MSVNRIHRFVGGRHEAHRIRNDFFVYLIVVLQGLFWAGVTDTRHLSWWRQLGIISIFSVLPYLFVVGLIRDPQDKRHEEEIAELYARVKALYEDDADEEDDADRPHT